MKIIALEAENFKKLTAVEIRPDGNLVQITGKNGNGKTSVLDAIWVALAGVSVSPIKPIREGQAQARIRLDLGEIVVTRTFKLKDGGEFTSNITVENADGVRVSSPQTMLDKLLGHLSFDPLAFARMEDKAQFDALRRFVPDVDFEAIERLNKEDYSKRTDLNRKAKEARTLADSIVVPAGLPAEPVDEKALIDQLEKAADHNAKIETRKANRTRFTNEIRSKRDEITRLAGEITRMNQIVEKLTKEADDQQSKLDAAGPLPEPVDVTELRAKIDSAKEVNSKLALKDEKQYHIQAAQQFENESASLTATMEKRDKDKTEKIANAKLPVGGISFGSGVVELNGVPFSQASDAEQLRASIAIAMALNPKLKVIRVRDGSLLDEASMKLIAQMANEKDYQVWVERVDDSGKVGFVLEDGHLKQAVLREGDE